MEKGKDGPDFATWRPENLVRFAEESYRRLIEQQEAIEQAQRDLKDAMNIIRLKILAAEKK